MTVQATTHIKLKPAVRKAAPKSKASGMPASGHAMDVFSNGKRCLPGKSVFSFAASAKKK